MGIFGFFAGLLIASSPFYLLLLRWVPYATPGRQCIATAYGVLFGVIAISVIMRIQSSVDQPFSLLWIYAPLTTLTLLTAVLPRSPRPGLPAQGATLSRLQKGFWLLCLGLIALRLASFGLEACLRPLYAWDAKQHWAKQAKVFYEFGSIVPFVNPESWLRQGGEGVFANMHPEYPVTMPLLQVWTAMAMGEWREDRVGLLWPVIACLIALVVYGQARAARVSSPIAAAGAYFIISLPYLGIQSALVGYSDLPLALVMLASFAAFANWSRSRERWQAVLALATLMVAPLIKQEGYVWPLTMAAGALLVWVGLRRGLIVVVAGLTAVLASLTLLPEGLGLADRALGDMNFGFRPDAVDPVIRSLFVHDNWHLLGYLAVLLPLGALFTHPDALTRKELTMPLRPLAAWLLAAALALYPA